MAHGCKQLFIHREAPAFWWARTRKLMALGIGTRTDLEMRLGDHLPRLAQERTAPGAWSHRRHGRPRLCAGRGGAFVAGPLRTSGGFIALERIYRLAWRIAVRRELGLHIGVDAGLPSSDPAAVLAPAGEARTETAGVRSRGQS